MGKTLKQGNVVFHIREDFYGGSLVGLEEAVELIKQSTIINMVGRAIVTKALEERLIHPDAVVEIGGIPHAQIVKI